MGASIHWTTGRGDGLLCSMIDDFDDDDEPNPADRVFHEFDCPECSANNPVEDGFRSGDEVLCSYCGLGFVSWVSSEGRLRLREP